MSPIVCVTALVTDRDHTDPEARVLLIKSAKPGRGVELPGGRVLNEESTVNAIYREVREETGLAMTHVAHFKNIVGTPKPGAEFGSNISIWEARAEGDPVAGDDAKLAFWASREDVRSMARHEMLSDLDSRAVLLEWAGKRLDETLAEAREATNLVSDLRAGHSARPGVLTAEARPAPPAGFAGTRARTLGEAVDSGHVVRLAEYVFADGSRVPYVEVHETHDRARPGRVLSCSAIVHLTQNVTDDEMWQIGAREGRPAPLTEDAQPITDAVQSLRDALEEGEHTFSSRIESRLVDVERAAAKLLTDFADVARELSEVRAPRDGGCECGYGCPYGLGCRHVDPPEPSALTEEEARAQWVRGYAAAVAAMVRWQGVTPEDALRDAGITVADLRGAKVFDHDIDVIVAKLSKGFISRGAIPPEVRHGSTPKAQAMFAKIIALNGRGPNVLHEWTTHDGLPVCSRCGVVRRADRDTTCKGSLPEVQQRTIPPEVRPAPEERRAPVQADHRRDPAKRRPAGTIAWSEHVAAWEAYARRYGTEQSAERIAERAGFGYWELTSFLGHEPRTWRAIGAPSLAAQADLPRVLTSDEAHAARAAYLQHQERDWNEIDGGSREAWRRAAHAVLDPVSAPQTHALPEGVRLAAEEALRLAEKATPGPWAWDDTGFIWGADDVTEITGITAEEANGRFIERSRTLLPLLARHVFAGSIGETRGGLKTLRDKVEGQLAKTEQGNGRIVGCSWGGTKRALRWFLDEINVAAAAGEFGEARPPRLTPDVEAAIDRVTEAQHAWFEPKFAAVNPSRVAFQGAVLALLSALAKMRDAIPPEVRPALPVFPQRVCRRGPDGACGFEIRGGHWECVDGEACGRKIHPGEDGYAELEAFYRATRSVPGPSLAEQADLPKVLTPDEAHAAMPTGEMAVTDGEEE